MNKLYTKLAKELDIPDTAVHLVHYVMTDMKAECILPPVSTQSSTSYFSAENICAALLAFVDHRYDGDRWSTLYQFGISDSEMVGRIVKAIQDKPKSRIVRNLTVDASTYAGLFSVQNQESKLPKAHWGITLQENKDSVARDTHRLLRCHFPGIQTENLVIQKRVFPEHVRADTQLALEHAFTQHADAQLFGIQGNGPHGNIDFQSLASDAPNGQCKIGPLSFSEVNIGMNEQVKCQSNGLWLAADHGSPFAVVLGRLPYYSQSGGVQIEIATLNQDAALEFADKFLNNLKKSVEESRCYRGKILSFEGFEEYDGRSASLKVHQLKQVDREQVILPEKAIELLDRNIIQFARQRPELQKRGMNLKKGLLFFGPPGTGKTHTVHYLSRALPDTTTFIITSEQIGYLATYMTLARLLQPSLVIIEDADLIARQRGDMNTCEEVLLNKLLNEMDGLRPDSEIIFVLTTNRPEALEAALAARPGRIDQAIEFPLPDESSRRRLALLYAGNQTVVEEVLQTIVSKTEKTSAAFIKELMRRATQYAIARGVDRPISAADVTMGVEEMLFSGNAFNRMILGAAAED